MIGDASLSRRPMGRVLEPLQRMGLEVMEPGRDRLPLAIARHAPTWCPSSMRLPVASAQIKSAMLIAGLHAAGATTVIEAEATRDHTERMLRHFGAEVAVAERDGVRAITVKGDAELAGRARRRCRAIRARPPSSSRAALIVPGSEITIEGVLVNPTRTGFYTTLREMGADVAFAERARGGRRAGRRYPRAPLASSRACACRRSAHPA